MLFGYLSNSEEIFGQEEDLFHHFVSENVISEGSVQTFSQDGLLISICKHSSLPTSSTQVFNHKESRITFVLIGEIFHYNNVIIAEEDVSELLLNEYLELGINLIQNLNGEYSLCIFDFDRKRHYFLKDHIGTTPLSIAKTELGIYFSTDTNGIAKSLFKDEVIKDEYIKSRFFGYAENYSFTPFAGMIKIKPAHFLEIKENCITENRYWNPAKIKIDNSIDFISAVQNLKNLLKDSVRVRIKKNFRIGAHISGGLDSSLVAAITRDLCQTQNSFFGFSWSPDNYEFSGEENQDERTIVRKQCQKSLIEPVFINTDVDDYINFLSEWRVLGDFHYESVNQKIIHKKGVNLIFSGWGGDEFIGLPQNAMFIEQFKKGQIRQFFNYSHDNSVKSKMIHFYNNVLFPFRRRHSLRYKSGLRTAKYLKYWDNTQKNRRDMFASKNHFMMKIMSYFHTAQRCEAWYTSGQRNGVTYTYPLLDKRIIEYCFSLKMEHFVSTQNNKPLLRAIGEGYLIDNLRNDKQLLDPVLVEAEKLLKHQSVNKLLPELQEYKQNRYLTFVDFGKIEEEIESINLFDQKETSDLSHILSYLKSVHSYTKNVGIQ